MDKKDISLLEQLLYNTDKEYIINQLKNTENSMLLHCFAANYNWNSGLDIPKIILENEACDLGTGLLMFYYADGYRMLEDLDGVLSSPLEEWRNFLGSIYEKLIEGRFNHQNISFDPGLTKVQKFKLKKVNINIPDILINRSPGEVVDIPKI